MDNYLGYEAELVLSTCFEYTIVCIAG